MILFSSVFSLNAQKQVSYEVNSGVQSISLGRNASHEMLKIDKTKATFPLILSFNFVVSEKCDLMHDDEEDEPNAQQVENVTN